MLRIRVIRSVAKEIVGSCEIDCKGGDAYHFGPGMVFLYAHANVDDEGNIMQFVDDSTRPVSLKFETFLDIGDFDSPHVLPGWKSVPLRRIIELGPE